MENYAKTVALAGAFKEPCPKCGDANVKEVPELFVRVCKRSDCLHRFETPLYEVWKGVKDFKFADTPYYWEDYD